MDLNTQEVKRLNQKLEQAVAALDQSNLELEKERQNSNDAVRDAETQSKITAQLNDISILRESNSTLRQQSSAFSQKVAELEGEIGKLKEFYTPLEGKLLDATAEFQAKEEQIKSAQQESTKWKERAQQILQKYERIDPEELKALREEVQSLKEQNTSLSTDVESKDQALTDNSKTLEELQAKLQESEVLQTKLQESEEKVAKLQGDYEAYEARFNKMKTEFMDKMGKRRVENKTLKEQLAAVSQTNVDLTAELESAQAAAATSTSQGEDSQKLSEELETTKQSLETVTNELSVLRETSNASQHEVESTKSALETAQQELLSVKADLEAAMKEVEDTKSTLQKSQEEVTSASTKLGEASAQIEELKAAAGTVSQSGTSEESNDLHSQLASLQAELESYKALSADDRVAQLESDNKVLAEQISELQNAAAAPDVTTDEVARLRTYATELEKQIQDLQSTKQPEDSISTSSEELEKLKADNADLQSQITTLQARVSDEMVENLEATNRSLEAELKSLLAQENSAGTITTEELEARLAEERESMQTAHSEAIAKLNAETQTKLAAAETEMTSLKDNLKNELVKENESRLAEIKTNTMQKMRDIIAQKTEVLKKQYEEEYQAKAAALQQPGASAADAASIRQQVEQEQQKKLEEFQAAAQEEKKVAIEQAREATKRETEMRLKLVQMKADKAEKSRQELAAQLAALQGNVASPAPQSAGIGLPQSGIPAGPSGHLQQQHPQQHVQQHPQQMPSSGLPQPAPSGLTFQGASQIGRGGSRLPVASGIPRTGIPRPGIPRPAGAAAGVGAGGLPVPARNPRVAPSGIPGPGIKRHMDSDQAAAQANQELKRRKEGENNDNSES